MCSIKRIIVEVTPEYHAEIKKKAADDGVSIKIVVLRSLALLMERESKKKENNQVDLSNIKV